MKKVDFFIFGAPKCGTTAMVEYLGQHPGIFFPKIKEPHFFCEDYPGFRRITTRKDYDALFPSAAAGFDVLGDASVWYLYSVSAAEKVYDYNPASKILVMLRNPLEMLPSLHAQLIFSGRENVEDFNDAWAFTAARKQGKELPLNVLEPTHLYYDEVCKYGKQLQRLFERFPREQVKVVFFEDFKESPKELTRSVVDFLGLRNDVDFLTPVVNKSRQHKYPRLAELLRNPPFPLSFLKRFLKSFAIIRNTVPLRRLYDVMSEDADKPVVKKDVLLEIQEVYRSDWQLLSRLTGRDLSAWMVKE